MRTLLVAVAVIGLGAVIGAVVVGLRVFDGTVVDHPYERGIAWDEERIRRETSGLFVSIGPGTFRKGPNEVVIAVRSDKGESVGDNHLQIRIARPETEEYTRKYSADRREDGSYTAVIDLPVGGRWVVTATVNGSGGPVEFSKEIYAQAPLPEKVTVGRGPVDCLADSGACLKYDDGGTAVSLDISPRPVRTMRELLFRVVLAGKEGSPADGEVVVDLSMPGMPMGENRVVLKSKGSGVFEGKGVIVRCTTGKKLWRATVESASIEPVDFTFNVEQ